MSASGSWLAAAAAGAGNGPSGSSTGAGTGGGAGGSGAPSRSKHPLHGRFHFQFMRRGATQGARAEGTVYGSNLKTVGSFGTVEDFWAYYSHMVRPNDLPASTDVYLFREGILPMWEDPANKNGGRWTLRLRKGQASRVFEDLAIGLVGEAFDHADAICGIGAQIRFQEDVVAVWAGSRVDPDLLAAIRDSVSAATGGFGSEKTWEFKSHAQN